MGVYQMFGRGGGIPNGGIMKPPPGAPAAWMPYTLVKDAKAAAALATANGGKIVNGPMEVPGGDWIAQGMDPQGAMFSVHSLRRPPPLPLRRASGAGQGRIDKDRRQEGREEGPEESCEEGRSEDGKGHAGEGGEAGEAEGRQEEGSQEEGREESREESRQEEGGQEEEVEKDPGISSLGPLWQTTGGRH